MRLPLTLGVLLLGSPTGFVLHSRPCGSTADRRRVLSWGASRHRQSHHGGQRLQQQLESIRSSNASHSVLLIDGDNVRGKSGFRLSKDALLQGLLNLHERRVLRFQGRVVLYYDHGAVRDALVVGGDRPVAVSFSGPGRSADDVMCRDVTWWAKYLANVSTAGAADHSADLPTPTSTAAPTTTPEPGTSAIRPSVVVITDDSGLRSRCRHGGGSRATVLFGSSAHFVELLGDQAGLGPDWDTLNLELGGRMGGNEAGEESGEDPDQQQGDQKFSEKYEAVLKATQQEQWLRVEIRKARQSIRHGCSRKKRTKLTKTLAKLEAQADALRHSFETSFDLPALSHATEPGASGDSSESEAIVSMDPASELVQSCEHPPSVADQVPELAGGEKELATTDAPRPPGILEGILAVHAAAQLGEEGEAVGPDSEILGESTGHELRMKQLEQKAAVEEIVSGFVKAAKARRGTRGTKGEHTWERTVMAELFRVRLREGLAAVPLGTASSDSSAGRHWLDDYAAFVAPSAE